MLDINNELNARKFSLIKVLDLSDYELKQRNIKISREDLEKELNNIEEKIRNNITQYTINNKPKIKKIETEVNNMENYKEIRKKLNDKYNLVLEEYKNICDKMKHNVDTKKEMRVLKDKLQKSIKDNIVLSEDVLEQIKKYIN
jgi:hypothetical protein